MTIGIVKPMIDSAVSHEDGFDVLDCQSHMNICNWVSTRSLEDGHQNGTLNNKRLFQSIYSNIRAPLHQNKPISGTYGGRRNSEICELISINSKYELSKWNTSYKNRKTSQIKASKSMNKLL